MDDQHFAVMSFTIWERQLFMENILVIMSFLGSKFVPAGSKKTYSAEGSA